MNKELQLPWLIIDKYFKENPNALVKHHLDSYDIFFDSGIQRILKEKNPIRILKMQDENTKEFKLKCNLYLGGKEGDKIYYGNTISHISQSCFVRIHIMSIIIIINHRFSIINFITLFTT